MIYKNDNSQPIKYEEIPVESKDVFYAHFRDVKLIKIEIVQNEYGHNKLKCTFGCEISSSAWTNPTILAVICDRAQRSVDDDLNYTDIYIDLRAKYADGIGIGIGSTPNIKFDLEFSEPWKKEFSEPKQQFGIIYHLSFNAGMWSGLNWWLLYKLNLHNLQKITFEFVKRYCYVQGQIIDSAVKPPNLFVGI